MDALQYTVIPSENDNPLIRQRLTAMIDLLETESRAWEKKTFGKTAVAVVKCKSALTMARAFVAENNWKAFTLVMQMNISVEALRACFHQNAKQKREIVKLYAAALTDISQWLASIKNETK